MNRKLLIYTFMEGGGDLSKSVIYKAISKKYWHPLPKKSVYVYNYKDLIGDLVHIYWFCTFKYTVILLSYSI